LNKGPAFLPIWAASSPLRPFEVSAVAQVEDLAVGQAAAVCSPDEARWVPQTWCEAPYEYEYLWYRQSVCSGFAIFSLPFLPK